MQIKAVRHSSPVRNSGCSRVNGVAKGSNSTDNQHEHAVSSASFHVPCSVGKAQLTVCDMYAPCAAVKLLPVAQLFKAAWNEPSSIGSF